MSSNINPEAVNTFNPLSITFNDGDVGNVQPAGESSKAPPPRDSTDKEVPLIGTGTVPVDNDNDGEEHAVVNENGKAKISHGRPIKATNLSIEDQIIIRMKRERRSDRDIADHLRAQGNVNYVTKTIGTRWARLRAKIATHRDKQLDDGEVNWTSKEVNYSISLYSSTYFFFKILTIYQDLTLISAVIRAKSTMAKLVAETEAKIWNIAVRELHSADRELVYSTRACRERYQTITEGNVSWYPELSESSLRQAVDYAEENLSRFKREFREADLEADEEIQCVITLHQDDEHTPLASPKIAAANTAAVTIADDAETVLDTEMNGLPLWISRASRQDAEVKAAFDQLEVINLPPVQAMKRKDLIAELSTRGFQSGGTVDQLRVIARRARNGHIDMPKSIVPLMDINAFKKVLRQRKVWEIDSADEDDVGYLEGRTDKEKKGGRIKVIPKNLVKNVKRKASAEQSPAPGDSILAAMQPPRGCPTKRLRPAEALAGTATQQPVDLHGLTAMMAPANSGLDLVSPLQAVHYEGTEIEQVAEKEGKDLDSDSLPDFEEDDP